MDRTIHVTTIYKCSCTSTLYNFYNDLYANAVEGGYGGMTLPVFCTDLSVHKKMDLFQGPIHPRSRLCVGLKSWFCIVNITIVFINSKYVGFANLCY